jgi:autotransporter-associated beta strand protein
VLIKGGSLDFGATSQTLGALTVNGGTVQGGRIQAGSVNMSGGLIAGGSLFGTGFGLNAGWVSAVLAGAGQLVKSGSGTLVLSANNTFSGGTVIESGTLQLGNGGFTGLLGTGALVNNSTLAFLYAHGAVIDIVNDISGTGRLEYRKLNGEIGYTVNFLGRNLTAGGTTLPDGVTLQVPGDAIFGTGSPGAESAPVTLTGGTLWTDSDVTVNRLRTIYITRLNPDRTGGGWFNASASSVMTIGADLRDANPLVTGDLIKIGPGTMVLNNHTNSYTGRTLIEAGTLTLGDGVLDGKIGAGQVELTGVGSRLVIRPVGTVDVPGRVTGIGSLTVDGNGMVRLLSNNDYAATYVLGGTLQLGAGGTTGTLGGGPVENSGLILFKRSGSAAITGPVTGGGDLRLDGAAVAAPADKLVVTLDRSVELSGDIEIINATLALAGTSSVGFARNIKVQTDGVFDVSSRVGGYQIESAQTLKGDLGRVNGTILMAGTLAPGNSPGTITSGGVTFMPGSTYVVEVDQALGLADRKIVSGTLAGTGRAELNGNGTVRLTPIGRIVRSETYRILEAPQVDGMFAGVTGGVVMFGPRLVYGGTYVDLEVRRMAFASFGRGRNAVSLGRYLDRFVGTVSGGLLDYEVALESATTADGVTLGLQQAGVSAYADGLSAGRRRVLDLASTVSGRLELLGLTPGVGASAQSVGPGGGTEGWSAWTAASSSSLDLAADSGDGFGGYRVGAQSSVTGVEFPFGNLRMGLLGASGSGATDFAEPTVRIKSEGWHAGMYASLCGLGPFFADGLVMYGRLENDATRSIEVPGFVAQPRTKFGSEEFALRLGGGMQVMPADSRWELTLTEHLLFAGVRQEEVEEAGGGVLGVHTGVGRSGGFLNELGLTVGRRWTVAERPVTLRLRCNWVHDFDEGATLEASLAGAPAEAGMFEVRTALGDRDRLKWSGSLDVGLTRRVTLRLGGEYETRRGATKGSVSVGLGMEF